MIKFHHIPTRLWTNVKARNTTVYRGYKPKRHFYNCCLNRGFLFETSWTAQNSFRRNVKTDASTVPFLHCCSVSLQYRATLSLQNLKMLCLDPFLYMVLDYLNRAKFRNDNTKIKQGEDEEKFITSRVLHNNGLKLN